MRPTFIQLEAFFWVAPLGWSKKRRATYTSRRRPSLCGSISSKAKSALLCSNEQGAVLR